MKSHILFLAGAIVCVSLLSFWLRPDATSPLITAHSAQPRCRLFVGIPKSGTTWAMSLMYTYLLLATGADPNAQSLTYANDHVKRAEYSCQYEWGMKQHNIESPREELAFRLVPAFSHVLRNADQPGEARKPLPEDIYSFERFFRHSQRHQTRFATQE